MSEDANAEGPLNPGPILDFIYHDGRRVASFLAQFCDGGLLTQVTESAGRARANNDSGRAEGGLGFGIAKGGVAVEASSTDTVSKESLRVYDPTWSNARLFLKELTQRGMLKKGLENAGIGQIVLCQGELTVLDLQMMGRMWSLPTTKQLAMGAANIPTLPKLSNAQKKNPAIVAAYEEAAKTVKNATDTINLVWEMVTILPHTIQAKVVGPQSAWCNLRADGITVDPSDIVLKHGTLIPGKWSLVGVLDARPNPMGTIGQPNLSDGHEIVAKLTESISPLARNLLGRPEHCFGVTPLLIFRELV